MPSCRRPGSRCSKTGNPKEHEYRGNRGLSAAGMPFRVRSGQRRLFACDALCHYRTYGTVTDCVNSRRRNSASSHICTIGACLSSTSRAKRQSFRFYRVQTFRYLNPLHPTEQRCRSRWTSTRPGRTPRAQHLSIFVRGNQSSRTEVTFCICQVLEVS
jgi:hypothetical protein